MKYTKWRSGEGKLIVEVIDGVQGKSAPSPSIQLFLTFSEMKESPFCFFPGQIGSVRLFSVLPIHDYDNH